MPEVAVLLLMLDLGIGQRGLAGRAPVDDALPAVNISLVIEIDKYRFDRLGAAFVESEALALPVAGSTEFFQLLGDRTAVLFFPLPNFLQESFASYLALIDSLIF